MLLRDLLYLIDDNNLVQICSFGGNEISGHAEALKEWLNDDILEYTVARMESNCDGEIVVNVEYAD